MALSGVWPAGWSSQAGGHYAAPWAGLPLVDLSWPLFVRAAPMPLFLEPVSNIATGGPLSINLAGILPERVGPLPINAVHRLEISADERPCMLGEIFHASGRAADGVIECRGDFSRVHFLAAGMAQGHVVVRGTIGRHAAEGMTGGRLDVQGDAGDWLAAELAGGRVRIAGRAGDNVCGSRPGSEHGMQGGLVVVSGDVGCLAGGRMRRGLLAVGGACGEAVGFELRSGTLVVGGTVGRQPGLGMRRGSIVCLADRPTIPACFRRVTAWTPPFLPVLFRRLARARFQPATRMPVRWRQWHGDLLEGCRGEILHPDSP